MLVVALLHTRPTLFVFIEFSTLTLFSLYIFDPRNPFRNNFLSLKDIILPILALNIGFRLANYRESILNYLNIIFLPCILYGVIQVLSFYLWGGIPGIGRIFPWDATFVNQILAVSQATGIPNNYFQGSLLRFFGTMNAFVDYQVTVAFLGCFLLLNRAMIQRKNLLYLNVILLTVFMSLTFDRSPLIMTFILIAVWQLPRLLKRPKYLLAGFVCLILVASFLYFGRDFLRNNPIVGEGYQRLINILTFNLDLDATTNMRKNEIWVQSLQIALDNPMGIGIGLVTPTGYGKGIPGFFLPHNNFLEYYLGYGILGLVFFLMLLITMLAYFTRLPVSYRFFGYGLVASFCVMSMFNMPFTTRIGFFFFLIAGYLVDYNYRASEPVKISAIIPDADSKAENLSYLS